MRQRHRPGIEECSWLCWVGVTADVRASCTGSPAAEAVSNRLLLMVAPAWPDSAKPEAALDMQLSSNTQAMPGRCLWSSTGSSVCLCLYWLTRGRGLQLACTKHSRVPSVGKWTYVGV